MYHAWLDKKLSEGIFTKNMYDSTILLDFECITTFNTLRCCTFIKVTGYGNGCGQKSKRNNLQWPGLIQTEDIFTKNTYTV